ncbi:hypothetical protein ABS71_20060 [bacterium SCN 62-11]|nr:hypothetical protein [Candidatus Eremiobacteraeota bacterium]ODT57378.1 MAG: hypothetical protein ABS71_20060 [bacterium SCN 62-11]
MTLAQHSRRWWDELDFFAPDVRRDLGRLFLQLERTFSSLPSRPQRGEPAGWSGLARRGSWDRLVHSEWAVSEAAPEEFVRRAGEGELSFWETAQQAGAQQDLLWCWMDVGPDQLGACRLVQLALMFYLQRLVQQGSGKFCWGCIQTPQTGYDALGLDEVKAYLRARSLDPGRRPPEIQGVNLWCIGSPAWLSQVPASYHKVCLTQTGPETVQLTYGPRSLQLQLPPGERAARLMRDPFSQQREPVTTSLQADGQLSFSTCGRKLVLLDEQSISLIPLPSSTSEPPGKVRRYQLKRPGRVVAFSWERHALHVCQEHQDEWSLYRLNPASQEQECLRVVACQSRGDLGSCWPAGESYYLCLNGEVWEIGSGFCRLKRRYLNLNVWGSRCLLADQEENKLVTSDGAPLYGLPPGPIHKVHLCNGRALGLPFISQIVALDHGHDNYQILLSDRKAEKRLVLRTSHPVLGVAYVARYQQPALVVRHPQHFQLLGADFSEFVEVGEPIEEACLHPDGLLAYRLPNQRLRCFDTLSQSMLWASS